MTTRTLDIVGRESELERIESFLDAVQASDAALLLEGEPGIGKTALCEAASAAARARGFEVLEARSVEAEAELALAAIGDLLGPILDRALLLLPEPQARALRIALLLEEGPALPDARALGVALLGALRSVAVDAPVLVVVDDVQWLDPSSAAVLRFAGRRIGGEPVKFLFARRVGQGDDVVAGLERIERLALGGLSSGALHRLVRERLGLVLTRPALKHLHELSGGNPFYALELASEFARGTIRLERGERLPPTLDALVGKRVAALPASTREALAAAAALSRPTLALVAPVDALAPAAEAGVIAVDGEQIRFTHPLLASAAYGALTNVQRLDLHRRLADAVTDVEERARHLALGTPVPSDDVAAVLDEAAAAARRRGAPMGAAELAEQARRLTPSDDVAAVHRRNRAAAAYTFAAGDTQGAITLLEQTVAAATTAPEHADGLTSLARIYIYEGNRRRAAELARRALDIRDLPAAAQADAHNVLAMAQFQMRVDLEEAAEHASQAVALAEETGERWLAVDARLTCAIVDAFLGEPARREDVEIALSDAEPPLDRPILARAFQLNAGLLMLWNDALDEAVAYLEAAYSRARDDGNEGAFAMILVHLALANWLAGGWDEARRQADEAHELAFDAHQRPQQALALAMRALVHAGTGAEHAARSDATRAIELAGEDATAARIYGVWALGLLDLSLGDFAAVVDRVRPVADRLERGGVREPLRFAPDSVEALIGLGRLEEAHAALATLRERAAGAGRPAAIAGACRCGGILAAVHKDAATAFESFEQALDQHAIAGMPFERARTLLAYGVSLRRARRKRAARSLLDEAAAEFERLGASVWARRAREEAARIGGRTAAGDELTATERKVAGLVAEGRTNREVAAALVLSPKTIEFHLRNIFRKLDVRSRTELVRRMNGQL